MQHDWERRSLSDRFSWLFLLPAPFSRIRFILWHRDGSFRTNQVWVYAPLERPPKTLSKPQTLSWRVKDLYLDWLKWRGIIFLLKDSWLCTLKDLLSGSHETMEESPSLSAVSSISCSLHGNWKGWMMWELSWTELELVELPSNSRLLKETIRFMVFCFTFSFTLWMFYEKFLTFCNGASREAAWS